MKPIEMSDDELIKAYDSTIKSYYKYGYTCISYACDDMEKELKKRGINFNSKKVKRDLKIIQIFD